MLPLREALRSLAQRRDRSISLAIVAPPYRCAGTGSMRVVRVDARPDGVAIAAAYEGYVRL